MKKKVLVEIICCHCVNELALLNKYVVAEDVEEALASIRGMLIENDLIVMCAKIIHKEVLVVEE